MTHALFADILRAVVSNFMHITFLFSMGYPKQSKKRMAIYTMLIICIQVMISIYFYLKKDYTNLAKFEFVSIIIACIISVLIFKVKFASWLFNLITATNAFIMIMVLSYTLSRHMPYPPYSHTLLRFVFFYFL